MGLMEGFDTKNQVYAINRSGWMTEKPLYKSNNYDTRFSLQCSGDNFNVKIDKSRVDHSSRGLLPTPLSGSFLAFSPPSNNSRKIDHIVRNNFRSNSSTQNLSQMNNYYT